LDATVGLAVPSEKAFKKIGCRGGTMHKGSRFSRCVIAFVAASIGAGSSAGAAATVCTSSGPTAWIVPVAVFTASAYGNQQRIGGATLARLFAQYGVTFSSEPPDTVFVNDDRDIYGGNYHGGAVVVNMATWRLFRIDARDASFWHNVLVQSNGNNTASFTLSFAHPVRMIRFIRAGLLAGGTGVTQAEWTAVAADSAGSTVATAHEDRIASYSSVPPKSFDLIGSSPIASVTFYGDNRAAAGFTNLVLQLIGWC
jgi:hypothetical protein